MGPAASLERLNDIAPLNNLADVLRRSGCRTQALTAIDHALAAPRAAHPLRPTLERTRSEVLEILGDVVPRLTWIASRQFALHTIGGAHNVQIHERNAAATCPDH